MRRHSIIARLGAADKKPIAVREKDSVQTEIQFIDGELRLSFGLGQIIDQLVARGIHPGDRAIDLAILAATVTAADTRISRATEAQDSWTREIDLYVPVNNPDTWQAHAFLIERMLKFLTGDIWRLSFRNRDPKRATLLKKPHELALPAFDSVCLFSGGLDSFVGAIDLLAKNAKPIFVSHYWDASTSSQKLCAQRIGSVYGDMEPRHVRAHVGFPDDLVKGSAPEKTTRGRSFLFLALAALAASSLASPVLYVPENGLISLNVPLDPLRVGAWSTRTTHPFYLARWQELLDCIGISATIANPYRFMTKGEMLTSCTNKALVQKYVAETISCSSVTKARWKGLPPGHCGHCTPCLIRRAAIQASFKSDPTPYTLQNLAGKPLDAHRAESEHIRSFQLMARRLSKSPGIKEILIHKPGPLSEFPAADITSYAAVFRRGIQEVSAILKDVTVKP
jgi:7-cyano-7-deazaguanine synthase in queuosine biosynthesis